MQLERVLSEELEERIAEAAQGVPGCCRGLSRGLGGLEGGAWQAGLADDGLESPCAELGMVGNRDRYGCVAHTLLHHEVTPALPDLCEAVSRKDQADLPAREDAQPTQR